MRLLRDFIQYIKGFFSFPFLFIIVFLSLDWFVLEPYIESKYLVWDVFHYNDNYWLHTVYVLLTLTIISIIFIILFRRSAEKIFKIVGLLLFVTIAALTFAQGQVKTLNLSVNTWFTNDVWHKVYVVSKAENNTISLKTRHVIDKTQRDSILRLSGENLTKYLKTNRESIGIYNNNDVKAIDDFRKEKKLPSLYTLKEGDTVHVKFAKGYLDVKYFK